MKKRIGIAIILLGCIISAVDIGRMLNGLAYGWDSILGGFLIAVASWIFLMESDHGLLLNAAKTAGCIAVIVSLSLLVGDDRAAPVPQNNGSDSFRNSNANYYRYDDYDDYDDNDTYEERICFYCNGSGNCDSCGGSGRYSYTASSTRGDRCPTCDGSGNCHGCNGRGTR